MIDDTGMGGEGWWAENVTLLYRFNAEDGENWERVDKPEAILWERYESGEEVESVWNVGGLPLLVVVDEMSEDWWEHDGYLWNGDQLTKIFSDSWSHLVSVATNDRGDLLLAWEAEEGVSFEWASWSGPGERPSTPLPLPVGFGLALDEAGVPWVGWITETTLELRKWYKNKWVVVPASEDVLDELPPDWRFHAFVSSDGQVLLRMWGPCGWQGLSGSDRDGGVSNAEVGWTYPNVIVEDDQVCVSDGARGPLRCHAL